MMKNRKRKIILAILLLFTIFIISKIEKGYLNLPSNNNIVNEVITTIKNITINSETTSNTASSSLEEVMVERVVDGDTLIIVNSEEESIRVRFIGVDTPESVNPDETKNSEEGTAASDYTKKRILEGSTLYLQYDEDKYDVYDRTLAYIWFTDDVDVSNIDDVRNYMYNAELILNGYAIPKVYEPNDAYADFFEAFYQEIK